MLRVRLSPEPLTKFILRTKSMMKFFNCFQLVSLFAVAPFLINWLSKQSFDGSSALFYLCCCIYTVMFFCITAFVNFGTDNL